MNLSFLNLQLTSPMGCCDRVTGTRQNSDCWSPLWWSWSSQAFAWPTTITGHVRNLGWFTELDVWLLYNFEATLKYVLILTSNFTRRLDGKLMSLASNWGFSRPEDAFQICITALVTGLVTVAGSVGYHWFSVVFQFLGFLREENSLKLLEPKLKISGQHALLELQLHNVSIQ